LHGFDGCPLRTPTADIGKQDRAGIARARLDANLPPTAGQAENKEHVRLARQEFGQIAVDRAVGRRKDVACDIDFGERGAPSACQRGCQLPARIRWRAWKRPKARDHHAHSACLFAHDLFRPTFARRSIDRNDESCQGFA
jgi:hypothetical protein